MKRQAKHAPVKLPAAQSDPLQGRWKAGLQGLKAAHRERVSGSAQRSVDVDAAFEAQQPNATRWDYGIDVGSGSKDWASVWLEVHTAKSLGTTDARKMVNKKKWLETQVLCHSVYRQRTNRAPENRRFIWIATNGVQLAEQVKAALGQAGIYVIGQQYNLNESLPK